MTEEPVKKRSFEMRGLVFIIKTAGYLFFCGYLIIAAAGSYSWVKTSWYRSLSLDELYPAITHHRQKGTGSDLLEALLVVNARPAAETQELLDKVLLPHAPEFEPSFYFVIAARYALIDNMQEALFWTELGLFRLRYDATRCKHINAVGISKNIAGFAVPPDVEIYIADYPGNILPMLERVLDWDLKNPPQSRPDYFCAYAAGQENGSTADVFPESDWKNIHDNLRLVTEMHIKKSKTK